MTIQDLSKIIRELISSNEESVQLPGFGSFIVVDTPSELINDGKAITPPSRRIIFESSSDANDPYFTEKYAKLKGISLKNAKGEVAEFLSALKRELVDKTKVEIPQFGTICFGEKGSFVFEAEPAFDFEADSYCLETISLKPRGTVEPSSTVSSSVSSALQTEEVPAIELVDESVEEPVDEPAEVPVEAVEAAEVSETEQEPEQEQENDNVIEKETEKQKDNEKEEPKEELKEEEKEKAKEQVKEQVKEQEAGAEKLSGHKRSWLLWGVLVAVGVMILMVVLMVVFKEQFKPLLEQLLYSKEELEILHQVNI